MEMMDEKNIQIDKITFQKMAFIYNALDQGWSVKKKESNYVFTKNHNDDKEVFIETYLARFVNGNLDINKVLS